MKNVEALKSLYVALGGMIDDVEDFQQSIDVLNKIAELMNGEDDASLNPEAIENIADAASGYIKPTGTKSITTNGTHDVTEYASADVNVPNPSTGTKSITENGTYDVTAFASANVNVSGGLSAFDSYEFNIANELSYDDSSGTSLRTITTLTPHQTLIDKINEYSSLTKAEYPFTYGDARGYFAFVITPKNLSNIPTPTSPTEYLVRKETYCAVGTFSNGEKMVMTTPYMYRVSKKSSGGFSFPTVSGDNVNVVNDALTPSTTSGNIVIKAKLTTNQKIAAGDYVLNVYDLTNIVID